MRPERREQMPYLNVIPTSFRLCVSAGKRQEHNVSLAGTLRLARKEKVTLCTEENFEQLEGNLSYFEERYGRIKTRFLGR